MNDFSAISTRRVRHATQQEWGGNTSLKESFQSSAQDSILGIGIDPQGEPKEADLSRTLAKQGLDQLGRFFGRKDLLDGSICHPANPHFQRRLALDVATPIHFPFPPGYYEHLPCLWVIVKDFQSRPAEQSALT
jgi:hypothetical protein